MKKSLFLILGGFVLVLFVPLSANALQFSGGTNQGSVSTRSGNLYSAGGNLSILQTVPGDLYAVAGSMTVKGAVGGDEVVAGGNLLLDGNVPGDLRAAGGSVVSNGAIGGDAVLAGGQVSLNGPVGGDAIIAGGNIEVLNQIRGDASLNGGNVVVNGIIDGNLEVRANNLQIGQNAQIKGTINYTGPKEAQVASGAKIGQINFTKAEIKGQLPSAGVLALSWFVRMIVVLTSALVLYFVFRRRWDPILETRTFGWNLLRGLVILIVIPVVIILLFLSVIGSWLGAIGIPLYVFFLLLAYPFLTILVGEMLYIWLFSKTKFDWRFVVLGVVVTEILWLIPVIGWLAILILFLAAFGSLWHKVYVGVRRGNSNITTGSAV